MGMFSHRTWYHVAEVLVVALALAVTGVMVWAYYSTPRLYAVIIVGGMVLTACLVVLIRLWLDPDRIRARQSDAVLRLASKMTAAMDDGLDEHVAQQICEMLLPATNAIAVAITDTQTIQGYAGEGKEYNVTGMPIRTVATHATIEDGQLRVIRNRADIGFPDDHRIINAAIIVPLRVSHETVGTLKFYYPRANRINETQESVAAGFGRLLSTNMAAARLDEQKKLATSMELKALQSQINPHFLFNTLNTIASFTRTDPAKARVLLRDFAKFYRAMLEDASDLIALEREVAQAQRYLSFETARFGEDRLGFAADVPDELGGALVPAFLVQPLVENAVHHAMPAQGKLNIRVEAEAQGNDLVLRISDDGLGMSAEKVQAVKESGSSTGLGIAVRNINDRILSYYGPESSMTYASEEGAGTTVTLFLKDGVTKQLE